MQTIFPEHVNFYPVMGIQAARRSSRVGGGWRLYVLAKALDRNGLGNIQRDDLRAFALHLGVSPRQFQRWMNEARNHDLLQDWQRKTGEWMLALPSAGKAAYAIKCQTVGNRKVTMPAALLVGTGWKARVWAAYQTTFNGRPVSRETMQKTVNVSASTQYFREEQAGVTRQRNYAKLKFRGDAIHMLRELSHHKALYIRRDGFIGSRKPDARFTALAERGRKGRARKANATLHGMERNNGLSLMRQAFSDFVSPDMDATQSAYIRQFNYTPRQKKATVKKLVKADRLHNPDVYERSHTSKNGSVIWFQF